MKRFLVLLAAIALTFSLAGCAASGGGGGKVKCPACGYEFDYSAKEAGG